jgi:hypothetical protein
LEESRFWYSRESEREIYGGKYSGKESWGTWVGAKQNPSESWPNNESNSESRTNESHRSGALGWGVCVRKYRLCCGDVRCSEAG